MSRKLTRRTFLERFGGATALTLGASGLVSSFSSVKVADAEMGPSEAQDRR
ncbi:MAG TPA: hypothetical protein VNN62_07375 [Methylomirabilota bacterium]|jgi:hypothetical protein|nr:hypothetical protein [Methylomirabilota bacterium]